jgi:putative ABC transport system ATP-binding protein
MHSSIVTRPVVELLAARKVYGHSAACVVGLDDIDFILESGDYVSIVGASGSGKSTLLNVVGTLDPLDAGTYRLDGVDVADASDEDLSALRCRKIGFVFQAFHLLPLYTAVENVELPLVYRGVPRAQRRPRAMAALERVGLADRANHRPTELSGGQQQRVSVARALVNEPALLLADEPTGALDSVTTSEILDLFESLHRTGVTILMVTHDREVAARTHRVVRMKDGRVADDRRNRPQAPRPSIPSAEVA